MNSGDAFLRAALYEQCAKSDILKHVDVESCSVESLRELMNKNNLLAFRKLPIILSKMVVKHGLIFVKSKVPQLKFITPENIVASVESDELQYLLESNSSMKPNLVFMVSKNILVSVIGSSISAFKDDLLSGTTASTFGKIPLKDDGPPVWNKVDAPKEYTSKFDTRSQNDSPELLSMGNATPTSPRTQSGSPAFSIYDRSRASSRRSSVSSRRANSEIGRSFSLVSSIASSSKSIKKSNSERITIRVDDPSSKQNINIISDVMIQPPNNYDGYESEHYDGESNYDDGELTVDEPTIKFEDIHETSLKPNAADFYSLVAPDQINNANILDSAENTRTEAFLPEVLNIDDSDGDDDDDDAGIL